MVIAEQAHSGVRTRVRPYGPRISTTKGVSGQDGRVPQHQGRTSKETLQNQAHPGQDGLGRQVNSETPSFPGQAGRVGRRNYHNNKEKDIRQAGPPRRAQSANIPVQNFFRQEGEV